MRRARRAVAACEDGGADPRLVLLTASTPAMRKIQTCNSQKILLTEARVLIGASVEEGEYVHFRTLPEQC